MVHGLHKGADRGVCASMRGRPSSRDLRTDPSTVPYGVLHVLGMYLVKLYLFGTWARGSVLSRVVRRVGACRSAS